MKYRVTPVPGLRRRMRCAKAKDLNPNNVDVVCIIAPGGPDPMHIPHLEMML